MSSFRSQRPLTGPQASPDKEWQTKPNRFQIRRREKGGPKTPDERRFGLVRIVFHLTLGNSRGGPLADWDRKDPCEGGLGWGTHRSKGRFANEWRRTGEKWDTFFFNKDKLKLCECLKTLPSQEV